MYETILVPLDGSAPSEVALDHALDLAASMDATIHALYVVDERTLHATQLDAGGLMSAYEEEGEDIVSEAADEATEAGVEVVTAIEHGSPHQAILQYSEEADIDLLVMGTHGRSGLRRYLIGSVTERVLRLADMPVLTIRAEETPVEGE
ncbi:universal stress protein [Haloferax mediterranei ATCC 33500]|uniref:Stress response protein n=1 Tax=Haloferax mediterranei (strain ATCC 33500 / DSM 1411 / JCM 8866 / NBRC 14739 / NCIMB 2177 / R-4) TaxID=523841 RepID=I3R5X2_HALMT|nr:universal stress protein [Haloferax mediterranei]AFK19632.1 stress response protein [Haloferax mediterranei ATCC 33500]AHZ23020.1 universal stress protein UspA [Haloferax mediterranei ATCC 33500]ELZ99949.1 stress response protein [Haloferax mediterranei ATCC 33500]MDX5987629.1 universal stress protein [Haloferax mediterranei ATCC 33500]QCQ74116.1 universal stress protein [Haloferax mediterranei ATCC 33500]